MQKNFPWADAHARGTSYGGKILDISTPLFRQKTENILTFDGALRVGGVFFRKF